MVSSPSEYLDGLIAAFSSAFEAATVVARDDRPERCLLEMRGNFKHYWVRLLEIVTPQDVHKYAYYVLLGERVIAGFDNAPK